SSIVSVPATAAAAKPANNPKRWTEGQDVNIFPSVSRDGTKLAYISNRSGNSDVWLKNLVTGKESALTETPGNETYPRISKDGALVMFRTNKPGGRNGLSLIEVSGGASREYCGGCRGPLYGDWIEDGRNFVYTGEDGLALLRVPSGESIPLTL